jgi:sugar lactone lactonase YvrE
MTNMKSTATILLAAFATACAKTSDKPVDSGAATPATPAAGESVGMKMGETGGMNVPESVRYDADLDVFFVSNISGNPTMKDGNGFISIVRADSTGVTRMLVESGKAAGGGKAITLNAPKGMAIIGDTLWVADIDVMHAINKRTGASIADVSVPGATFLNDVAVGADGAVYFTDTGIKFDASGNITHPGVNRIFRLAGRALTTVAEGDSLRNPNGLAWDATGKRWLLAPFDGKDVQTLAGGARTPTVLASGPGQYDGIEMLADGRVLVSSWADSSVYVISNGAMTKMVSGVEAPADIGVDTKRMVLAIPRFNAGKIEYYMIH